MSAKRCTGCGSMYLVKERITFCSNCGINLRDNIQATTKVCAQSSPCERGHSKWKFCATCGGERYTQTYFPAWNVVTATVPTTATTTPKSESELKPESELQSEPESELKSGSEPELESGRPGSLTSYNNHGGGVENVAGQRVAVEAEQPLAGLPIRENSKQLEPARASATGLQNGGTISENLDDRVGATVPSIIVFLCVFFSSRFEIVPTDQIYIRYTSRNCTVSLQMRPVESNSSDGESIAAEGSVYCVALEFPRNSEILDADDVDEFTPVRLFTYCYYLKRGDTLISEAPTVDGAKANSLWRKLELTKHEVNTCVIIKRFDGYALPYDENRPINKMFRQMSLQYELEAGFAANLPQLSIGSSETQSDKLEFLDLDAVGLVRMVSQYLPSFTAAKTVKFCVSLLVAHLKSHIHSLIRSESKLTCSIILLQALVSVSSEKIKLRDIFVAMAKNDSLTKLCEYLRDISPEWIKKFEKQFKHGPSSSTPFYKIWQSVADVGEITTDLDWIRRCVKEAKLALAEVPQLPKQVPDPIFALSLEPLWNAIQDNLEPRDTPT